MALEQQHVLSFSPDGKLFAFINDQGILRIWDTDTNELKQEYTPNLHLSGPCSALVWITVASGAETTDKNHKKQRKSSNVKESLYIALGTNKGQVSLYSYAEAKIERNFKGEGHNGKITCIVRDTEGRLFTSGEDCRIVVWSIAKEKQLTSWQVGPEKPYSIAYMPVSKSLVVGSRQIKVYSVETQELLQEFTGHMSKINFMEQFVINNKIEYALTTSHMERIICMWKIGKKGRNKPASCTLLMEDIAYCLSCQLQEEDNKLKVCSVTRSGVIHVYVIDLGCIAADKPIKPKLTICIASDSVAVIEPITAIASSLKHAAKPDELLFAYGDKNFLLFEQLKPNFNEKLQVLIRSDPKKLIKEKLGGKGKKNTDLASKTLTPIINSKTIDYKSAVAATKKKVTSLDMPMESRLQNLNLNAPEGKAVPQSQSKVQLLVQSLHSKNADLLRSVLCTKDMKTIKLTLQRLPVQYLGTLVNELTLLMQKKHTNVEFAMKWLKILAETHSSQLMALGAEDLLEKFGPCIGIIEHRSNCLKELSKLNGRLELLVRQIKRNAEQEIDNLNIDNVLVFEDNDDSSNSDLEDAVNKTSSDDEWEEGEDNDNEENVNGNENMEQDNDDIDDNENMEM